LEAPQIPFENETWPLMLERDYDRDHISQGNGGVSQSPDACYSVRDVASDIVTTSFENHSSGFVEHDSLEDNLSTGQIYADSDLMPLPLSVSPSISPLIPPPSSPAVSPMSACPSPAHQPITMQVQQTLSPIRPAWSIRASGAPALGVPSNTAKVNPPWPSPLALSIPLPLSHPSSRSPSPISVYNSLAESASDTPIVEPTCSSSAPPIANPTGSSTAIPELVPTRRRAYRWQLPDFDIALAMQLRPGLGLGADPAWMVRFLMAIFGWLAILLAGVRDVGVDNMPVGV
jgi:hypothetical protein